MLSDVEIKSLLKTAYESNIPKWRQEYMARICKNLQVHTKGLLFSKVDTLFPNEHPDSKAHCVNTYEPITKGSAWKAINNLSRIFSNSSFSVSASDSTLEFINENRFGKKNLFSFFLERWMDNVVATDPNALCAIYPEDIEGATVRFIRSEHLKLISRDMIVFISEEDSEKTYNVVDSVIKREVYIDPSVKGGINARSVVEKTYNQQLTVNITRAVYHVFTHNEFIRFSEAPNSMRDSLLFDYEIFPFAKPFDNIPAFELTGTKLMLDINESFIASFIPFGNLTLLQHRNHRAVDLMFSYPRMSEIQTPCDNLNCVDGTCQMPDGPDVCCSRCGGSGFVTVQSPYKVYQKRIDTGLTDPETIKQLLAANPVDFYTPDTSILKYSQDSWKDYLRLAEEAVFIQQKQLTGNVESGKAKEIDKEGEYSWIQNIGKAYNMDFTRAVQALENYLNTRPAEVSVEQPQSFAIVTETEAFETLAGIIESDAPIFIKAQKVENFVHKFLSKSSPVIKALKVLKVVDPLLFYSQKEVQNFKSNNAVSVEAWVIHIYAYSTLMNLYAEDPNLFEQEGVAAKVLAAIPQAASSDLKTALNGL